MRYAIAFLATGATFLALDLLWLGIVARDFYRSQMAHLIAPSFQIAPAVAFYLIYVCGVIYFAVNPALASGRWQDAIIPGALIGFLAYATYDLTNWAVLRDWPVRLAFLDMAWGTLLTCAAATLGAWAALRFG